jgi:hypothetical protein
LFFGFDFGSSTPQQRVAVPQASAASRGVLADAAQPRPVPG